MGWPGPMTYRQMRTWSYWLDNHYEDTDIQCWYLMQIAQTIHQVNRKNGQASPLSTYKLKMQPKQTPTQVRQQIINNAKNRWVGVVGAKVPVVVKNVGLKDPEGE